MPSLPGLLIVLVGLIMLHYGMSGEVFPIPRARPASDYGGAPVAGYPNT